MRAIYDKLDLGDFGEVEPGLLRYAIKTRDYRTNKYALPPDVAERVRSRWAAYFERYGYQEPAVTSASA
jgi:hypothetical protein